MGSRTYTWEEGRFNNAKEEANGDEVGEVLDARGGGRDTGPDQNATGQVDTGPDTGQEHVRW